MERLRAPFVDGARARGVDDATANEIFRQIAAFAEFGFCKSHAAAFALTAYHTAHLKLYYPAEFYVALLNNQPMGFYSPAVIAGDAKRHGVAILPVDVNRSFAKAVVESSTDDTPEGSVVLGGPSLDHVGSRVPLRAPAPSVGHPLDSSRTISSHRKCRTHDVRIGLASVKGLGEEEAKAVVKERELGGEFKSFDEFATRVGLKEEALRNLALVGAFDSFGEPRRALLWRARDAHRTSPSFVRRALSLPTTTAPALPPVGDQERTALDYRITGIPTGPQIMSFYREDLALRANGNSGRRRYSAATASGRNLRNACRSLSRSRLSQSTSPPPTAAKPPKTRKAGCLVEARRAAPTRRIVNTRMNQIIADAKRLRRNRTSSSTPLGSSRIEPYACTA